MPCTLICGAAWPPSACSLGWGRGVATALHARKALNLVQSTLSQRQHGYWCNERLLDVTDCIKEQAASKDVETFDSYQQNVLIGEEQNLKYGQQKIKAEKGNIKHSTTPEGSARLVELEKKPK